jgi:hypothetical protein
MLLNMLDVDQLDGVLAKRLADIPVSVLFCPDSARSSYLGSRSNCPDPPYYERPLKTRPRGGG